MKPSPFPPKTVGLLLACAVGLFALSVVLHAYDTTPAASGGRFKPGSYSVSAIGHAGLYDMLRRLDRPVLRSVGNTLSLVGAHGTLIVAEPEAGRISGQDAANLMTAPRLLLVLPKWQGLPHNNNPAWITRLAPVPLPAARYTLGLVAAQSDVLRTAWPDTWTVNKLKVPPAKTGRPGAESIVQLIRSKELRPVVGTAEGMLVGEMQRDNTKIWVLSDPDILANHGIVKGDNAAFMLALIDRVSGWKSGAGGIGPQGGAGGIGPQGGMGSQGGQGGPIVFDETVHGFQAAQGSPIKLLFRFPFVVVTALLAMLAVLLALAGTGRFGVPRTPPPVLDFGKANLIGNGARLLDYAGHHAVTLKRYVRMVIRTAARSLHAPPGLDDAALVAWLDRIGKARGVSGSAAAILNAVAGLNGHDPHTIAKLFDNARNIDRWKGELLHGSASHRRHSPRYQD